MSLWSQCEDLLNILLVFKFEMNRPNIKLIITFCAIWHYRDLKRELTVLSVAKDRDDGPTLSASTNLTEVDLHPLTVPNLRCKFFLPRAMYSVQSL